MLDDRVTANFTLGEFVVSDTATRLGIDNMPPAQAEAILRNVTIPGMQRIRNLLCAPVVIKSGYRCPALNAAVRGAAASQHVTGSAVDFIAPGYGSPRRVCELLAPRLAEFGIDQLICEGGWTHVSFGGQSRRQVLTAHFTASGVTYTSGLA